VATLKELLTLINNTSSWHLLGKQYEEYVWLQVTSTVWIVTSHTAPTNRYSMAYLLYCKPCKMVL